MNLWAKIGVNWSMKRKFTSIVDFTLTDCSNLGVNLAICKILMENENMQGVGKKYRF